MIEPERHVQGRLIPTHPLDILLLSLDSNATTTDRLEVLWRAYEESADTSVNRPPRNEERAAIARWTRKRDPVSGWPMFMEEVPALTQLLHRSLSEKAAALVQMGCRVHQTSPAPLEPAAITFPIGIEPWSAQARSDRVAIRSAVNYALVTSGTHLLPWGEAPICLTISALVPARSQRKDVDNLVKGVIDAMEGRLFLADGQVACLTARRIEYSGTQGAYFVHAVPMQPWDADVIFDDPTPPNLMINEVRPPARR